MVPVEFQQEVVSHLALLYNKYVLFIPMNDHILKGLIRVTSIEDELWSCIYCITAVR